MPSLEELLENIPKEKRHKYVDESSDVNVDPVTDDVEKGRSIFEKNYNSEELNKVINWAQANDIGEGVDFNNLKNIVNGSLNKATMSNDDFIKENFRNIEKNVFDFFDQINSVFEKGVSFEDLEKEELKNHIKSYSDEYKQLKFNADFSIKNKRKRSQVGNGFDYFERKDDEKEIWFDSDKGAVLDWKDYKKDSDLIVKGGKWHSDVAKDIDKEYSTGWLGKLSGTLGGPLGIVAGAFYDSSTSAPVNVLNKDPKDVYDKAYSILNDVDRPQEKLAVGLTSSYFQKVLKERGGKDSIEALTEKYFDGKNISYSKHRDNVRENVVHMLNSFVEFEDEGKNKETAIKLLESYENSDRDDKWFNQGTNKENLLQLSESLTSSQSLYVFNKMEEGNSTLNNPYYFDDNIEEGQNKLNLYNNQIKQYLENQKTLKSSLNKLDQQVRDEMLLETGVNKKDFFSLNISKNDPIGNRYRAIVLTYGYNDNGSRRSANEIREAFVEDNYNTLTGYKYKNSMRGLDPLDYVKPKKQMSFSEIRDNMKVPEKFEDVHSDFNDIHNQPHRQNQALFIYDKFFSELAEGSSDQIKLLDDVHDELKERFGKDEKIVSKVYENTLLENSVGYEGQEAVGFDYIDINDVENKRKSSLLSNIVETANTTFEDVDMSSNVYIKRGEFLEDVKPSFYKKIDVDERKKILTDFFKNSAWDEITTQKKNDEDKQRYDLRFIDTTGDKDMSAYTIRKSDTDEIITLYFNKDLARNVDKIFASNAYNNLNDEIYNVQGYYDLSAYNTRNFKDLKLQNVNGKMYVKGSELKSGEEIPFSKEIGYASRSSVDDAIEHVKRYIIGFNNNK